VLACCVHRLVYNRVLVAILSHKENDMNTNTICKQLYDHGIDFEVSATDDIHAVSVSVKDNVAHNEWVNLTDFSATDLYLWLGY